MKTALRTPARAWRAATDIVAVTWAARDLAAQRPRVGSDRDALLDLVFGFEARGVRIAPIQKRAELRGLVDRVAELDARAVLEIGTAHGGTLFALTQAAADDAILVSVDLPREGYRRTRAPLYRSFARERQKVRLVRADSHRDETVAAVRSALDGRRVDFLLIDGDHSYEGVRRDFELYAPLVRDGGLIAFHDIVEGPPENVGGVPRFWREVRALAADAEELVDDPAQGGLGIGLLRAPAPRLSG